MSENPSASADAFGPNAPARPRASEPSPPEGCATTNSEDLVCCSLRCTIASSSTVFIVRESCTLSTDGMRPWSSVMSSLVFSRRFRSTILCFSIRSIVAASDRFEAFLEGPPSPSS